LKIITFAIENSKVRRIRLFSLLSVLLYCSLTFAQHERDSLFRVLAASKVDTNRVNTLNELSRIYTYDNPDSSIYFATQAKETAEKIRFPKGLGNAYHRIGLTQYMQGDYDNALENWSQAFFHRKENNDFKGASSSLSNIALIYAARKQFDLAIDKYYEALEMDKQIQNVEGISRILGNIGNAFEEMGFYEKALKAQFEALSIRQKQTDKSDLAYSYMSIGNLFLNLKEWNKALEYHQLSLDHSKGHSDKRLYPIALGNIGVAYFELGETDKAISHYSESYEANIAIKRNDGAATMLTNIGVALATKGDFVAAMEYHERALKIHRELEIKRGIANTLNNIGSIHLEQKRLPLAENYFREALNIAVEIGALALQEKLFFKLYQTYLAKKDYRMALEAFTMHSQLKDSLNLDSNAKNIEQMEMRNSFEMRIAQDSLNRAHQDEVQRIALEKQDAQIEKQRSQMMLLIAVLIFAVILIYIVFSRFKSTKRQHEIIQKQKELVDTKNEEIAESIRYAQRIQKALLPDLNGIKEWVSDYFVLYKPKDIVAGDFYWMYTTEEQCFLAAADCTGHGVPGAMVSVVCNNALNRSIHEFGLNRVDEILNSTREIVVKEFEKSGYEVNDGMDISLVSFRLKNKPEDGEKIFDIEWSGANNPLWIIRKESNELEEIKGDKQPIGKFHRPFDFTRHSFQLKQGDQLYLLTDGFQDQFGGETTDGQGKKFKPKRLKQTLCELSHLSMSDKRDQLENILEEWIGNLEQVDDVCVIGVRF
jgi:tetratricopeptide (TPR) repeat protein